MSAISPLLTDPHPCRHIVYPYADESRATHAVHVFASAGLSKGESVILLMTDSHCEPIERKLTAEGFDLPALQASGQLKCIKAEDLLPQFMRGGMPDDKLFRSVVGDIIDWAKASSPSGKARVFGELVSLLFGANNIAAAERLEELWNEMIEACSVALLCTYSLDGTGHECLPDSLLKLHSHSLASLPMESFADAEGVCSND